MKNVAKRGRPSVFCDEYIAQAYRYAMLGATDEQMAHFFGVSRNTLDRWKTKYAAFAHALQHGKTMADQAVLENLYKLANGYELTETKELSVNGLTQTQTVTKKMPPSLGAIQFWLKNRMRQDWNERHQAAQEKAATAVAAPVEEERQYTTMGKVHTIMTNKAMETYMAAAEAGYIPEIDQYFDLRRRDDHGNILDDEVVDRLIS
jgi:hypothetical protein